MDVELPAIESTNIRMCNDRIQSEWHPANGEIRVDYIIDITYGPNRTWSSLCVLLLASCSKPEMLSEGGHADATI